MNVTNASARQTPATGNLCPEFRTSADAAEERQAVMEGLSAS